MKVRVAMLLLLPAAGCGDPSAGSAAGGHGAPERGAPPAGVVQKEPDAGRSALRSVRLAGAYRRTSEAVEFWPCGSDVTYEVVASPEARIAFREALRWRAPWPEQTFFAVVRGAVLPDSAGGSESDTTPARRVFVTRVDSLRLWRASDCRGRRPPWR